MVRCSKAFSRTLKALMSGHQWKRSFSASWYFRWSACWSGVLLLGGKSISSSPCKGLLGWDRSWGSESQVRPLNWVPFKCLPPPLDQCKQFIAAPKNQLKPRRCTCRQPFSKYHRPSCCSNCRRRSNQHAVAGVRGNDAIISARVLQPCPASVWDNMEQVNLHAGCLLHAGQAQHLFSAECILHLNDV